MVDTSSFGPLPSGGAATRYNLKAGAAELSVSDFGVTVIGLCVPDAEGRMDDIVLGMPTVQGYLDDPACYGCTIGPVANRTEGAMVPLSGNVYMLEKNDGPDLRNNLHSSLTAGLHKRLWQLEETEDASVTLGIDFADDELGLPGRRHFTACFALAEEDCGYKVTISYRCESDKETFVNMTNHTYFNLAGHTAGTALDAVAQIPADEYIPVHDDLVTEDTPQLVAGTPFDFRVAKPLSRDIDEKNVQLKRARGYDHCFCIRDWEPDGRFRRALAAEDPRSGRTLEFWTSAPGMQLYTGNWLDDKGAKEGARYTQGSGFALEAEYFPNCANRPTWPHPICTPEHPYELDIAWKLGTAQKD